MHFSNLNHTNHSGRKHPIKDWLLLTPSCWKVACSRSRIVDSGFAHIPLRSEGVYLSMAVAQGSLGVPAAPVVHEWRPRGVLLDKMMGNDENQTDTTDSDMLFF